MYGNNSDYVKSAMCSGIQWDMIMKNIDGKYDSTGKEYNVRKLEISRHTRNKEMTGKNLNDKVNNIYDLEWNCTEYVAKKNNKTYSFVCRGGNNNNNDNSDKASLRNNNNGYGYKSGTCRLVLYII